MAETSVPHSARSGGPTWRRWLVGAAVAVILAGAGTGIALWLSGGSASTGQTPAVVTNWMQSHPDVAAWMLDHPGEWTWMREHWSDMQWMHERWSGMAWLHDHPGVAGGSGMMMGSMPMAGSLPEMRQWMSDNAGTWAWMQAHWSSMSFWMGSHWSDLRWMHDHWSG